MIPVPSSGLDVILPIHILPSIQSSLASLLSHTPGSHVPFNVGDPANLHRPLAPFDNATHTRYFGPSGDTNNAAHTPTRSKCFDDEYVHPTLSENEYARLTMLWYYTIGIEQDVEMLGRFSQLMEVVKSSLGWDIALVGLIDADTFTRIAAVNIPLASAPRRESPCSHTINHFDRIFAVTDMQDDWRFQNSPQARNGLRSYAGTQIRLTLANGEEVSLGTVCVASLKVLPVLGEDQEASLVKIADVIMGEIVSRKRLLRAQERQAMTERLSFLRVQAHSEAVESKVLEELHSRYPSCSAFIGDIQEGKIELPSGERIMLESVRDDLWEDTSHIKTCILANDFDNTAQQRIIRAVIAHITPDSRIIALNTTKMRCIFDDLDIWFVDQCAQIINTSAQALSLKKALNAKNTFLRSITHELRTPIHAILSSVELAAEAIRTRDRFGIPAGPPLDPASLSPFLDTIRRSSNELMTTVNNILRLNAFDSEMKSLPTEYDLQSLEMDVLDEIFANYAEEQLQSLSVRFDVQIPTEVAAVRIDGNLLRELLKCLILNAVAATSHGSVLVTISLCEGDKYFVLDVIDTGIGIDEIDHNRVFQAFEKVNPHTSGAGVGLSLAIQLATTLNGQLSLVSSKLEEGSHFRVQLPYIPAKVTKRPPRRWSTTNRHLSTKYNVCLSSERSLHLVEHVKHHLQARHLEEAVSAKGAVIITNEQEPFQETGVPLRDLDEPHAILWVCENTPSKAVWERLTEEYKPHMLFPIMGPLYTSRLDSILLEVDQAFSLHVKTTTAVSSQLKVVARDSFKTLPYPTLSTPPATPSLENHIPLVTSPRPTPTIKALLVDDNKVNLSVLQMYCKRRKITHGIAHNGNEAVSEFCHATMDANNTSPYTVIFMDLQMPECDGVEACRQIRSYEREHDLSRSIIFILTGQDSINDRKGAFEAGVDDYFVKPVGVKKLDQALAQYISSSPG